MRRLSNLLRSVAGAGCVLAGVSAMPAHAQNYPNKVITFIVPSSPGGPGDVSARLIADRMSVALGQQIIIETIPGAGGTIGMSRVARAAADGYTLLIHQNGFAITPSIYEKLPFDTARDFTVVGLVNQSHTYLVGRTSLPANTFAELVTWMRGPGKPAKVAHPGMGTNGYLQTLQLMRAMGTEGNLIPYRGIAPAVNDLLGGHVDISGVGAAVAAPHMRAGTLKAFASSAPQRDPAFPNVPTYGELGHKELQRPFWHALFAPAATPRPILDKLNAALRETLADPKIQKAYADSGVEPFPSDLRSIDAGNKFVQEEIVFWGKIVRENNVKAE